MAIRMIVFDYRDTEREFFRTHELENFDITFFEFSLNEENLDKIPQDVFNTAVVVSVFINSDVSEKVINAFKNLRIISTRSTGVEHINRRVAESKNISIVNVELYGARSVAQFTFCLIMSLVRHVIPASKYVLDDKYKNMNFVGRDISKLTLGVVGTGSIGVSVCKIAKSFGMKVIVYDLVEKQELTKKLDIKYVSFNTLLRESDIVTLHIPYTGDNRNMFGREQFAIMKNTAYIINTSRGELLNIKDFYDAISMGAIKGGALDVVTCEDVTFKYNEFYNDTEADYNCLEEVKLIQELAKHPEIIITPHIAYETQDAIDYILQVTFIAIIEIVKGENMYRSF